MEYVKLTGASGKELYARMVELGEREGEDRILEVVGVALRGNLDVAGGLHVFAVTVACALVAKTS